MEDSGHTYASPLAHMVQYLDTMDAAAGGPATEVPVPRVLAALRPQMLALARDRADGAIAGRIRGDLDAGADHVLLQPLGDLADTVASWSAWRRRSCDSEVGPERSEGGCVSTLVSVAPASQPQRHLHETLLQLRQPLRPVHAQPGAGVDAHVEDRRGEDPGRGAAVAADMSKPPPAAPRASTSAKRSAQPPADRDNLCEVRSGQVDVLPVGDTRPGAVGDVHTHVHPDDRRQLRDRIGRRGRPGRP